MQMCTAKLTKFKCTSATCINAFWGFPCPKSRNLQRSPVSQAPSWCKKFWRAALVHLVLYSLQTWPFVLKDSISEKRLSTWISISAGNLDIIILPSSPMYNLSESPLYVPIRPYLSSLKDLGYSAFLNNFIFLLYGTKQITLTPLDVWWFHPVHGLRAHASELRLSPFKCNHQRLKRYAYSAINSVAYIQAIYSTETSEAGYLLSSGNFNPLQSAYRTGHSTKTALLRVYRYHLEVHRQHAADNYGLPSYVSSFWLILSVKLLWPACLSNGCVLTWPTEATMLS